MFLKVRIFRFLLFSFLFLYSFFVAGQKINDRYELNIQKTTTAVTVDGLGDDEAWARAEVARDFFMVLPMDTSLANVKTEVRITYDDRAIYVLATCYKVKPGPYVVESLRRDFNFGKNDNFLFFFDPFDDRTSGFSFGTNAAGAQWDGFIYEGGKMDLSWENKWVSAVKNYDDRWVMEAAVPFKSIRFKKGVMKWGLNFSRNDLRANEKSAWAPVPRQFPTVSLAYTGNMVWDVAPPETGSNISLIPYVLGGVSRDYEKNTPSEYRKEIGADAKISVTSSLNLDLTVNPDFSQVEVDKQVTNLDRFELFFPERRQFFLENADLFGNVGYANIRPFFSRRIGLDVPIQFGARLSGRINKDWRMGVMDIQTRKVSEQDLPTQNFAVVSLQRKMFSRSNIGFMFVNKQSLNYTPDDKPETPQHSSYNRNFGFEYNLASPGNYWTGKMLLFKSFSPGTSSKTISNAANLNYTSRHWAVGGQYEYVGRNYSAEVGYVPRTGYVKVNPQIAYLFFPRSSQVLSHGPVALSNYYMDESFHKTDYETSVAYKLNFRNQAILTGILTKNYVKLLKPFDPTNTGKDSLPVGSEHHFNAVGLEYFSRPQRLFTWYASGRYGGYYADGKRLQLVSELGYRFQPYVSIIMSATFTDLRLPQPWGHQSYWLVGPRLDVTMTNKLFFTAFGQYNEQIENFNLNMRLQWRYKPASDFYIVYTDNYLPENLSIRNRALVLKFTYWFSL
nr:carbohydrate binding family 9 domain-containing protein [Flavihumibacter fluvii]